MQLIKNPKIFDVIVTNNIFWDIISDESRLGSAPDIAGQNKANPIAMILSGSLMLEFLGMQKEADNIQKSVEKVVKEAKVRTPDLGGTNNTQEMCDEIIRKL